MIPALQQAAFDPTLRGRRLQVYVYLCSTLDTSEWRYIKFRALAGTTGMQRTHLSNAINHLVRSGYIDAAVAPGDRRRRMYRLMECVPQAGRKSAA